MKQLPIFLSALVLFGCVTARETSRSIISTGWDFRECTKNNFFITTEPPTGIYDPIGVFSFTIRPSVMKNNQQKPDKFYWISVFDDKTGMSQWCFEYISPDTIINIIYKEISSKGANAFTKFSAEMKVEKNGDITVPYWEVSGFAIKRK
jgi:hypothetical protein